MQAALHARTAAEESHVGAVVPQGSRICAAGSISEAALRTNP
jgi:hypothetical protein